MHSIKKRDKNEEKALDEKIMRIRAENKRREERRREVERDKKSQEASGSELARISTYVRYVKAPTDSTNEATNDVTNEATNDVANDVRVSPVRQSQSRSSNAKKRRKSRHFRPFVSASNAETCSEARRLDQAASQSSVDEQCCRQTLSGHNNNNNNKTSTSTLQRSDQWLGPNDQSITDRQLITSSQQTADRSWRENDRFDDPQSRDPESCNLGSNDLESCDLQSSDPQLSHCESQTRDLEPDDSQSSDLQLRDLDTDDLQSCDLQSHDFKSDDLQSCDLQINDLQSLSLQSRGSSQSPTAFCCFHQSQPTTVEFDDLTDVNSENGVLAGSIEIQTPGDGDVTSRSRTSSVSPISALLLTAGTADICESTREPHPEPESQWDFVPVQTDAAHVARATWRPNVVRASVAVVPLSEADLSQPPPAIISPRGDLREMSSCATPSAIGTLLVEADSGVIIPEERCIPQSTAFTALNQSQAVVMPETHCHLDSARRLVQQTLSSESLSGRPQLMGPISELGCVPLPHRPYETTGSSAAFCRTAGCGDLPDACVSVGFDGPTAELDGCGGGVGPWLEPHQHFQQHHHQEHRQHRLHLQQQNIVQDVSAYHQEHHQQHHQEHRQQHHQEHRQQHHQQHYQEHHILARNNWQHSRDRQQQQDRGIMRRSPLLQHPPKDSNGIATGRSDIKPRDAPVLRAIVARKQPPSSCEEASSSDKTTTERKTDTDSSRSGGRMQCVTFVDGKVVESVDPSVFKITDVRLQ